MHPPLRLKDIEETPLDVFAKGFPPSSGLRLNGVGGAGWNLLREDVPLPAAVLRNSALQRNRSWMRAFLAHTGARLAPHGKTSMCPQLFELQLQDGAWGMTAATSGHVLIYRRFGVRRVLLANQLVGRGNIASVLDALAADPEFDFYCLVDDLGQAGSLARAVLARGLERPLQVLVEVGLAGGRTGVRSQADGLALARAVAATPGLALRGVECFEGMAAMAGGPEADGRVRSLLGEAVSLARACEAEGLFAPGPVVLTAGGSGHYDLVVQAFSDHGLADAVVVLRSGCYLTHDFGIYAGFLAEMLARSPRLAELAEPPAAALEVWAAIQSIPEPGLAIAALGKRDISHDVQLPTPLWRHRPGATGRPHGVRPAISVRALNDQHALLDVPPDHGLAVGDLIGFGVSHPCTTFDRWPALLVVDDDYNIVSAVRTFF